MNRRLSARLDGLAKAQASASPGPRAVLLVPGTMPAAEWEAAAVAQQEALSRDVRTLFDRGDAASVPHLVREA